MKEKKNQEKNLVNSNLVSFTWTDLIFESECFKKTGNISNPASFVPKKMIGES